MPTMKLWSDDGDLLELEVSGSSSDTDDVLLVARLRYSGFACTSDAWISQEQWLHFSDTLLGLERQRQGEARLASISPGELELVVRSTDRAGHMCVEGRLGVRTHLREVSLRFSALRFDPSQLVGLAREVQRITAKLIAQR